MEAEWRLFPVIKEMWNTERLCAQEPHQALLSISLHCSVSFALKCNVIMKARLKNQAEKQSLDMRDLIQVYKQDPDGKVSPSSGLY